MKIADSESPLLKIKTASTVSLSKSYFVEHLNFAITGVISVLQDLSDQLLVV